MEIIKFISHSEAVPPRNNSISKRPAYYSATKLTSQFNSLKHSKPASAKSHLIRNSHLYSFPKFSTDSMKYAYQSPTSHNKWRAQYITGGFDFGREGRRKYTTSPRPQAKSTGIRTFSKKYEPSVLAPQLQDQHPEKRHYELARGEYGII